MLIYGYSPMAVRSAIKYAEDLGWQPPEDDGGFDLLVKPERAALSDSSSAPVTATAADDSVSTSTAGSEGPVDSTAPTAILAGSGGDGGDLILEGRGGGSVPQRIPSPSSAAAPDLSDSPPAASAHTGTDTPKTAHLGKSNDTAEASGGSSLTYHEMRLNSEWHNAIDDSLAVLAVALTSPLKRRIAALEAEMAEAVKLLAPFADEEAKWDNKTTPDEYRPFTGEPCNRDGFDDMGEFGDEARYTLGDLRRAASFVSRHGGAS